MRATFCGVLALATVFVPFGGATAQRDPSQGQGEQSQRQSPLTETMLGVLEVDFKPAKYAQLAIWIEKVENGSGSFLTTVRLTEAVSVRGIGNRPGASQMNSGFRWPYGRREGVLPVWATRRVAAPNAKPFHRVIFQKRLSEGLASRTSDDFSQDDYYCLSFNQEKSSKEALDAVSCASVFNSDKGRFVTQSDVSGGYAEPYEQPGVRQPHMRTLSLDSLYPPRRDFKACLGRPGCNDHADSATYDAHVREVMPEIDSVTMATPAGEVPQHILFTLPNDWMPGDYRACLEINVEGDYNDTFNPTSYPVPQTPADKWDSWALTYGYPYRGQPSVVYCTDFVVGGSTEQSFTSADPVGSSGGWDFEDPNYGTLRSMDGMTDDPVRAPGSGADRLQLMDEGWRMKVSVKPPLSCRDNQPPSPIDGLVVENHPDKLNAHHYAQVSFKAAADDRAVVRYDLRVSTDPIVDEASFRAAMPAKQASLEAPELLIPVDKRAGEMIRVDMGGLVPSTHYFVGVRAMDGCVGLGPISYAEVTTPTRSFTTVTPCFVATAAWGSPLEEHVGVLRRVRDRFLLSNAVGRAFVSAYYSVGPALAGFIREHDGMRAVVRTMLTPIVELSRRITDP